MEEDRIHLERIARRNLRVQGLFILVSLAFLAFTMIYAVNTITTHQTAEMNQQREARLAVKERHEAEQFAEIAKMMRYGEEQRVLREQREIARQQKMLTTVHQAMRMLKSHDQLFKQAAHQ